MKFLISLTLLGVLGVVIALIFAPGSKLSHWVNNSVIVWDRADAVPVPRVLTGVDVNLKDLPVIAAAMSQSSDSVRYATLAFCPLDCSSDDDALNVQISIENEQLGLDWVLLGPANIRDEERFTEFAEGLGFEPSRKTQNGVTYLRIDTSDAATLAGHVLTEMYGRPPEEAVALYHEGFDWPQT